MLLTLDRNHPSIVQLSLEYRSGIGCLYHKSLQRIKLIMTTSFGWSRPESSRTVTSKGDLREYWEEISSSRNFLTTAPSYVAIRDPVRRLCHRLITHSIARRGQAPEKAGLHGLTIKARDLTEIDLDKLARLYICEELADTWVWVASRSERQQAAVVGAP
ncbi:hypothetical protein Tco_1304866 [Tanacetum coccineum]